MANLVVLFRTALIFVAVILLSIEDFTSRILGLIVFLAAIFLDYVDGYCARKLQITSQVGASLDMLGDRITENVMLIFFAYKHLIPVGVAIFFVSRAFVSDYIRSLNFCMGKGTYDVNTSRLGYFFVASSFSRAFYLIAKMVLFSIGSMILIIEVSEITNRQDILSGLNHYLVYLVYVTLTCNIIRFIYLVYDSRDTLQKYFLSVE